MSQSDDPIDRVARSCIAVRVRLLNRVITNMYDDAFRSLGLKISQANILVVAARLGVARPGQVCELLNLDASTLSRNVERMQAKGWLEVVPDDADGRSQPFRITAKGRELLKKAEPAWEKAQAEAKALLGESGVEMLHKVTRQLGLSAPKTELA